MIQQTGIRTLYEKISHMIMEAEYTSTFSLYFSPFRTSGAMYLWCNASLTMQAAVPDKIVSRLSLTGRSSRTTQSGPHSSSPSVASRARGNHIPSVPPSQQLRCFNTRGPVMLQLIYQVTPQLLSLHS